MKLSLFMNVLLISTLSLLAVGCGKDKKKSSNNSQNYYNPYIVGQAPTFTNGQALTNLQAYVNGVETNNSYIGYVNVMKQRYSCKTKDFLGISFLPYDLCSYSQINEPLYATPGQVRSSAFNNPGLLKVLNPVNGYVLGNVIQYGSGVSAIFQVDHVLNTGTAIETIQYTVESSRHSVSNPTIIKDTAAKRIDTVL